MAKFRFIFDEFDYPERMYSLSTLYKYEIMAFTIVFFHNYAAM